MAKDNLTFFSSLAVVFLFTLLLSTNVCANTNTVSSNTVTTDRTPPSAISPSLSIVNSDICKSGISGSVTSSVIGVSSGITITDEACRLIKYSRQLKALGLSVPAVSILAQDPQVFDSLWQSGIYPPHSGEIGEKSKEIWLANVDMMPEGSIIKSKLLQNNQKQKEPEENFNDLKDFGLMALSLLLLF